MPRSLVTGDNGSRSANDASKQARWHDEDISPPLSIDASSNKSVSDFKKRCTNIRSNIDTPGESYEGTDLKKLLSQHRKIIKSAKYKEIHEEFVGCTTPKENTVLRDLPDVAQQILNFTELVTSEYRSKEAAVKSTISANKSKDIATLLLFESIVVQLDEWRDKYKCVGIKNNPALRVEHMQRFFPLLKEFRRRTEATAPPASLKNWLLGRQKVLFSSAVKASASLLKEYFRDRLYINYTELHDLHELTAQQFAIFSYRLHTQFAGDYAQMKDKFDAKEYHTLIASMAMFKTMQVVRNVEIDSKKRSVQQHREAETRNKWQRWQEAWSWAAEASRQGDLADQARARKQANDAERAERRNDDAESYLAGKNALCDALEFNLAQFDNARVQTEAHAKARKAAARAADEGAEKRAVKNAGDTTGEAAKEGDTNERPTQTATPSPSRFALPSPHESENKAVSVTFSSRGTAYPVINAATGEKAVVLKKDTIYETKNADGTSESYKASEVLPIRIDYIDDQAVGAAHGPLEPGAYKSTGKRIEFPQTTGRVGAPLQPSASAAIANRVQPYPVQPASAPYKASPGQRAEIDLTGAHAQPSYRLPRHLSRAVLDAISAPPVPFDSASAVRIASPSRRASVPHASGARRIQSSDSIQENASLSLTSASFPKAPYAKALDHSGSPPPYRFKRQTSFVGGATDNPGATPGHHTSSASAWSYVPDTGESTPASTPLASVGTSGIESLCSAHKITQDQLTDALKLADIGLQCLALERKRDVRSYTSYAQQFLKHLNTQGIQQDIHVFPVDSPQPSGSGESSKRSMSPVQSDSDNKKHRGNPQTDPQDTRPDSSLSRADSFETLAQADGIAQSAPAFFENHPERAALLGALQLVFARIGEKKLRRANRQDLDHLWVEDSMEKNREGIRQRVIAHCGDFKNKEIAEQRLEHGKGMAAFYEENTDTAAYCGEITHLFMAYIAESKATLSGDFFVLSVEQSKKNDEGEIVPLDANDDENGSHAFILYTESDEVKTEISESYNDDEDADYYSEISFREFAGLIFENKEQCLILDPWGIKKVVDISAAVGQKDVYTAVKKVIRGAGLKYDSGANQHLLFSEDDPANAYP